VGDGFDPKSARGNVDSHENITSFQSGFINFYYRVMALFITESHAGLADYEIDRLL
jgi:hypothetical protein